MNEKRRPPGAAPLAHFDGANASTSSGRCTGLQVFSATIVGAIERSRDTLGEAEYVIGLELLNRWVGTELVRARKASRRLRVVG